MRIQLVELKWLCLEAFTNKLAQRKAQYISMLKGIKKLVNSLERKLKPEQLELMTQAVKLTSVQL